MTEVTVPDITDRHIATGSASFRFPGDECSSVLCTLKREIASWLIATSAVWRSCFNKHVYQMKLHVSVIYMNIGLVTQNFRIPRDSRCLFPQAKFYYLRSIDLFRWLCGAVNTTLEVWGELKRNPLVCEKLVPERRVMNYFWT